MQEWIKSKLDTHIRHLVSPHYVWLSIGSIAISLFAIWVIATTWNIDSNFKNLLPENSEAAKAFTEASDRVGSSSSLFVVVDSPSLEANLDFAKKYAEKLRELPLVALAHFHNDKSFFKKNILLYADVEKLRSIRKNIENRIKKAKREANPLFVSLDGSDTSRADDPLEPQELEKTKKAAKHSDYKEYLVSDDKYSVTIIVRFTEASTNLVATNKRLEKISDVGRKLNPESFHPEMKIQYGGGLADRQEDYNSIVSDIKYSAIFTVMGIFLLIGLFFGRFRAIPIVLTPLVMGVLWTLAIGFTIFGELTTISVFIFAIILGLGIDYGIHLLSSYDDYRSEGLSPVDSLVECYTDTGRATLVGATTTFMTFVIISFAEFKGLSQFGQVSSIGIVCTFVAMLVVLPSFVLAFNQISSSPLKGGSLLAKFYRTTKRLVLKIANHRSPAESQKTENISRSTRTDVSRKSRQLSTASKIALIFAGILTIGSIVSLPYLQFEENFDEIGTLQPTWKGSEKPTAKQKRRNDASRSARKGARYIKQRSTDIRKDIEPESYRRKRKQTSVGAKYTSAVNSKVNSMPTIFLFDSKANARDVYDYIDKRQAENAFDTFRAVDSIYAFLPGSQKEQKRRLDQIRTIKSVLENEDLSVLDSKTKQKIEKFRPKLEVDSVSIYDLPLWTKRFFREAGPEPKPASEGESFAFEYVIMVNPAVNMQDGSQARRFLQQIETIKKQTGVDFKVASQAFIYVSMLDHVQRGGTKMITLSFILIFALLAFVFGRVGKALVALVPLSFGLLWMLGVSTLIGLRLNFFNVIIIPAIIGIGVDDGVHLYFRYLKYGKGSIQQTLETVGFAILMTSLTSSIGFGGLAIADYNGLKTIGYLAIVGILSTLAATLLVLPALLQLAEANNWQQLFPEESSSSS